MATPVRGMSSRALQAEQTRQQILQTAQRLFAEHGYDATSLQMIADEMGLTKAAVYYYFRAKIDISREALRPGAERLEDLLDEAAAIRGRRARTEHIVNGLTDFLVQNRRYAAAMASAEPVGKRNHLDEESATTRTTIQKRALSLLFGSNPTAAERLAFNTLFFIPECLPNLADLTDEELHEALRTTMLRMLRV